MQGEADVEGHIIREEEGENGGGGGAGTDVEDYWDWKRSWLVMRILRFWSAPWAMKNLMRVSSRRRLLKLEDISSYRRKMEY